MKELDDNNEKNQSSSSEDTFDVQDTSLRYYVGYVLFKTLKKFNCDICENILKSVTDELNEPSETLIKLKIYDQTCKLVAPSKYMFDISKLHLKVFNCFIKQNMNSNKIKQTISQLCIDSTKLKTGYENYFDDDGPCINHRKYILDFFILVLIRKTCIWKVGKKSISQIEGNPEKIKNTNCSKLKILNH